MKRIIITESQAELLKRYLNEAPIPKDDFAKEVEQEFTKSLSNVRLGQKLVLFFGQENEDGSWNEDELTVATFMVLKVQDDGDVLLQYKESRGKQTALNSMDDKDRFIISPTSSFDFNGGNPQIKIIYRHPSGKTGGVTIQNFLQFEIVKPELDIETIIDSSQKKWEAIRKELSVKAEFEPSWFGMDNLFFYPKGFEPMKDIANKYGALSDEKSENGEPVKLTLVKGDVGSTGKFDGKIIGRIPLGSKIEGVFDKKNQTITFDGEEDRKFVFNIKSGDEVATGSEYFVTVDVFIGDKKAIDSQETRIKITNFPKRK